MSENLSATDLYQMFAQDRLDQMCDSSRTPYDCFFSIIHKSTTASYKVFQQLPDVFDYSIRSFRMLVGSCYPHDNRLFQVTALDQSCDPLGLPVIIVEN